jgi:hypothetical protein
MGPVQLILSSGVIVDETERIVSCIIIGIMIDLFFDQTTLW